MSLHVHTHISNNLSSLEKYTYTYNIHVHVHDEKTQKYFREPGSHLGLSRGGASDLSCQCSTTYMYMYRCVHVKDNEVCACYYRINGTCLQYHRTESPLENVLGTRPTTLPPLPPTLRPCSHYSAPTSYHN